MVPQPLRLRPAMAAVIVRQFGVSFFIVACLRCWIARLIFFIFLFILVRVLFRSPQTPLVMCVHISGVVVLRCATSGHVGTAASPSKQAGLESHAPYCVLAGVLVMQEHLHTSHRRAVL